VYCVYACVDSHCSEHPWRLRSEMFIPGNKSIFALAPKHDDEEADQQQCAAAAADDDDDASDGDAAVVTVTDDNNQQFCESRDVHSAVLAHDVAAQRSVHDDIHFDSVLSSINEASDER